MNEENIQTQENIFPTEKIETNLQEVNSSINKLLEFFQTDKQEKQEKEKQEQNIQEQEQQKIKEEQEKKEEEQEKKEEEFLQNIQTIADNTNSEISTQLLNDVSTLMQVNIITSGLLIGIVCVSLFAKFFKK